MQPTFAFDVYGTLIDTEGVLVVLEKLVGGKSQAFSETWRDKQLEYSFRRGLMDDYVPFSVCTEEALLYSTYFHKVLLNPEEMQQLLHSYKKLPTFPDVKRGLTMLKAKGYKLYAFSNGTAEAVDEVLTFAGIRDYFVDIISVDDVKTFKPNPKVYDYLLEKIEAIPKETWLISSNTFDIIGASSLGIQTAWVQRSEDSVFDPWGIEHTIVVENFDGLVEFI